MPSKRRAKSSSRTPKKVGKKLQEKDEETEFFVEAILGKRELKTGTKYLVKWAGYEGEDTWEWKRNMEHDGLGHHIEEYEESLKEEEAPKSSKKKTTAKKKKKSQRAKTPPSKSAAAKSGKKTTTTTKKKKKSQRAKTPPSNRSSAKSAEKVAASSTASFEVAETPGVSAGEALRVWILLGILTVARLWIMSGGDAQLPEIVRPWAKDISSIIVPVVSFAALSMNPNAGLNIPKWVSIALIWFSMSAISKILGDDSERNDTISMGCSIAAALALVVAFSSPGDRHEEGTAQPNLAVGAVVGVAFYAVYESVEAGLNEDPQLRMLQQVLLASLFCALWAAIGRTYQEEGVFRSRAVIPHAMGVSACLLLILAVVLENFNTLDTHLGDAASSKKEISAACSSAAIAALTSGALIICGQYL